VVAAGLGAVDPARLVVRDLDLEDVGGELAVGGDEVEACEERLLNARGRVDDGLAGRVEARLGNRVVGGLESMSVADRSWISARERTRNLNSTISPTLATTLLGSKRRPPRPRATRCVTTALETGIAVVTVTGSVVVGTSWTGAAAAKPATAAMTIALVNILLVGYLKARTAKRRCDDR